MLDHYVKIVCVALYLVISTAIAHAELPQISSGLSYLTASQNTDGTWHTGASEVETTAATISVLDTLKLLNQTAGTPYAAGTGWLQTQTPQSVDYIAQRIQTLGLTDAAQLVPVRDTLSGAWGGDTGYETDILDTALALQALKSANYTDATIINPALAYLTTSQNTDGGWGFYKGDGSNVYMTAVVSATLQQFPQMTTIATAVGRGTSFLLAHQNSDGGFGSSPSTVFETALAYAAIAAISTDATVLGGAVNYLTATQSGNGSWNDDPYATALALKALHLSENRPSPPPPPPPAGTITGIVVDATTNQRVAGVSVVLGSNDLIRTTTDSLGGFSLKDVPPGSQSLNFSLSGYASKTASAAVVADIVTSLGNIPLVSSYSTGTIAGTITNPTGNPLADVTITVTGAWSGTATTGTDGAFSFTYVTPGQVTITAAKTSYQTVTGNGTVFARTTLTFSQRLGTIPPPQASTGALVGRVVADTPWGPRPIDHLPDETGVTVTLSGGISVPVEADDGGYFNIQGLLPNTYQAIIGMNGYASHAFRAVITAGGITDLGTITLKMSFAMTLTGQVTDAVNGTPLSGAEIIVTPGNLTARSDFAGTYAISDINETQITVRVSARGYSEKTYTISKAPWVQTLNFALTPKPNTGRLTGTIVDATTGAPLAGARLTLLADASVSATTLGDGTFTFYALSNGVQQIKLSLDGYIERILTTAIKAGVTNDIGKIGLSSSPLPASVQGSVWDAIPGAPFAGAEVIVSGNGTWQAFSDTDGKYMIEPIEPGIITVSAGAPARPEYYGTSISAPVAPGGILVYNTVLTTIAPPGVLKGIVKDFIDDNPVQGAAVLLNPSVPGIEPAFTDPSGAFSISEIPAGTYSVTVNATGYYSKSTTIDVKSGNLGETTIVVQVQRPGSFTSVAGKIYDTETGNPIANATVSIVGTELTSTTSADGSYSVIGIRSLEFTMLVAADGYDSFGYGAKTQKLANYLLDLRLKKSGTSTTRIFGTVTDLTTNTPIIGAEVVLIGSSKSTLTDAYGKYSLNDISEMMINVKASAPGYDSQFHSLALSSFGEYEMPFVLSKSRTSTVAIKSFATDKASYTAREGVSLLLELENTSEATAEMNVEAQIADEYGDVRGLISFAGNPVILGPHEVQTVSLAWDTELNAPGVYYATVGLVDKTQGGLFAEDGASFTISPAVKVDEVILLITPKFINIGTTPAVAISTYMVNGSNADAVLTAHYSITNPEGTVLKNGQVDFPIAASEPSKTVFLTEFLNTFVKSGEYPVTVNVLDGSSVLAQAADSIYVAPAIRIEPQQTLNPTSIIPDGDKSIRINILLKGVEALQ